MEENKINKFTFYRNFYEIIRYLPDNDRLTLYDTIVKYMFEQEEPELKDLLNGIWVNMKMVLDTNKKNITNGQKGGAPDGNKNATKTTQKQPTPPIKKTTQKQPKNILLFNFLILNNNYKYIYNNSIIYNKIKDWLNYKEERKEIYKEMGLKCLLTQIEKNIDLYGEDIIVDLIDECMANNYKGIIFDKLKKNKKTTKKRMTEEEVLKYLEEKENE